jgi:hypothetical protein
MWVRSHLWSIWQRGPHLWRGVVGLINYCTRIISFQLDPPIRQKSLDILLRSSFYLAKYSCLKFHINRHLNFKFFNLCSHRDYTDYDSGTWPDSTLNHPSINPAYLWAFRFYLPVHSSDLKCPNNNAQHCRYSRRFNNSRDTFINRSGDSELIFRIVRLSCFHRGESCYWKL